MDVLEKHCPACGLSASYLKDYRPKRLKCQCWQCGSLERHRFAFLFMKHYLNLFGDLNRKILHIAPEKCFYGVFKDFSCYVTSNITPGRLTKEISDIENIPHRNKTFDMVYCSHVLEHVTDDRRAMREIKRVLRRDGFVILDIPVTRKKYETYEDFSLTTGEQRLKAFGQADHVRAYGYDVVDRLEESGLAVETYRPSDFFSDTQMRYYALSDYPLYLCTKKTLNTCTVPKRPLFKRLKFNDK